MATRGGRLLCIAAAALAVAGAPAAPAGAAGHVDVRRYDLGPTELPAPGPLGALPVRVRGVIAVPAGPGPHPLALVLHGRHDPGCPPGPADTETWPCFAVERRYDVGLRHVVRALAQRGIAAVAPSLGGAFTGGWGEPDDRRRWPMLVETVLAELVREVAAGGGRFGVALHRRLDLRRIGMLGHSLSGLHAVTAARRWSAGARGRPVAGLLLVAPVYEPSILPDVPIAVVVGSCDGDTGTVGRGYLRSARRQSGRSAPVVLVRLRGANHNFFNDTLTRLRADDAPGGRACRRDRRMTAGAQARWLDRAAASFFATTLRGTPRPAWLRPGAGRLTRLYGARVRVWRRDRPVTAGRGMPRCTCAGRPRGGAAR